ncbi:hypothetical protein Y032_0332g2784 [Ancylostoma ceylanicum]|uniref:Uncharacterized protein n=1 Tax=Ancylostoma ceylanicum TaxID=53326 RepID=A0A016RZZ2_9BILA|nr:hypothetical protein Y032_0332g2784 [Ancylostoma ceylanicum]
MAACTYITHEEEQSLIMARTKFLSVKEKHHSEDGNERSHNCNEAITSRLRGTQEYIDEIIILTDSEIVLNWIRPKEKKF